MSTVNTVTEQLTRAGQAIEHDSFAIIDAEVQGHSYTPEQWPIVRRMIHANADFDFNGLTDFHPQAVQVGIRAMLRGGTPVVADVEMICSGLSVPRLAHCGMVTHQCISAADTKPTGMPTTSAGRTPSSAISRASSISAVGALPMPTMAPSSKPRRWALRMACTARVVFSAWAWAITAASEMN